MTEKILRANEEDAMSVCARCDRARAPSPDFVDRVVDAIQHFLDTLAPTGSGVCDECQDDIIETVMKMLEGRSAGRMTLLRSRRKRPR